ncbi:MAG: DUF465 domain-containing protein [Desulfuromusa sp.]|jgi:uncharacterized protein YdcH (DUF465 family)|nr:DUF465 domain-containing protein [Desulfuromusa sp.]
MDVDQTLLQNLTETNPRFRMLYEEHNLFEKQLSEYDKKGLLSPEEELEKNKVKKMKLVGKDEMEKILLTVTA